MFKDQILENENRRKIYSTIRSNPGIHLRELERETNLPLSTTNYHVEYLTRKQLIFSEKDGKLVRFYIKKLEDKDKQTLLVLRQKKLREIVFFILINKQANFNSIAENFKIARSTLSFYLKNLVDKKILERNKIGYENIYTIKDEDRIARTLITYKSSFIDKIIDKTLAVYLETSFKK